MPEEIFIFMFILFIALLISLFIYIRAKILDFKIMKHSNKIQSILKLNQSFDFHSIESSIKIVKFYDNKSHFNKIKPGYLMSSYIRNNLDYFSTYITQIKENRDKKIAYNKELTIITSQPLGLEYKELKISKKEYIYREKKLVYTVIYIPIVNCTISVFMSYSSPKGQVNLSKRNSFSFEDLVVSFDSVSRSYLDKETYSQMALVERGEISDSLRYDILNRDDFKCVICGASSREGVRLHVDHIIPVSKGGKSVPNNLRTLCERCNVGKSDKLEGDVIIESSLIELESLLCPKCGAKLVLRHGKNGEFYGCSNFPKCKFTMNV